MFAPEPIYTCQDCGRRYAYNYRRGHSKHQCNSCRTNRGGLEGRHMRQKLKGQMIAELDKCVPLCMNCDAEEHDRAEEARDTASQASLSQCT